MNKLIKLFFTCILFINSNASHAQLVGSGKIKKQPFNNTGFKQIAILDFDGTIDIEVGKPFSINVEIDDNLAPDLKVQQAGEQLTILLSANENGKLYLEKTNIKIKISLPNLTGFKHRGNTDAIISGINEKDFLMESTGNGNMLLLGQVDQLNISKDGNGNIDAGKLMAKKAKVKTYGNGDVYLNAEISLTATGSGNGNVVQKGAGKLIASSAFTGNGKLIKE